MDAQKRKAERSERRKFRVRKAIHGTAERPRLSAYSEVAQKRLTRTTPTPTKTAAESACRLTERFRARA